MSEIPLWCTKCEFYVEEDIYGWYACNCTSREIDETGDDYPSYWIDPRSAEPYDTLEEKYL